MNRALIALLALSAAASCAARERAQALAAAQKATILAPAWSVELDFGGPLELRAARSGFAVFGSGGQVVFFDGADGSIRWRTSLAAPPAGIPVVGEAEDGSGAWAAVPLEKSIALLDLRDGQVRAGWPRPPGELIQLTTTPASLIVLAEGGKVFALDPSSGKERWSAELPGPPALVPASACRGQILAGLKDGRLAGLDGLDGTLRWTQKLRSPAAAAPSCAEPHAFVATIDNTLHALRVHRRGAGRMWKVRSGADPVAPPQIVESSVLFLSKDTYLYGLRRRNGHLAFRIRLGRRPGPAALLDDLVLVSGLQAKRLDAYRLPSGLSAGGFDLPEDTRFVTPPVVSGARVAFGVARFGETDRARLIALTARRADEGPLPGSTTSPEPPPGS